MNQKDMARIQQRIANLPKGRISIKHIHGKEYEYWQFYENGKQISKRVKGEELHQLQMQIEERKKLQSQLRSVQLTTVPQKELYEDPTSHWMTSTRIGEELLRYALPVQGFNKREIFSQLSSFIYGPSMDRVCILYGLRRTGKTTLIRQLILSMPDEIQAQTAFMQIGAEKTLADVNHDLRKLEKEGFRYVFMDEVTLLSDFIDGAALFSDIFAASGMKIILSGTDSLGFLFAEEDQLYDRCTLLHTTFIPYREFHTVLGIHGIDQYIRYGGTMSLSGVQYQQYQSPFSTEKLADAYVDSAIARNIQHSLKYYQHEGHFRALFDLYEQNELISAINRVVEDMNHRFTLDVLTRVFTSHDLGVSKTNLMRDRQQPTDALAHIDNASVIDRLRALTEIKNKDEQLVTLTQEHVREIQEYLAMLDLTKEIDVEFSGGARETRKRTIFTQPGLRYAQAEALVTSLMQDRFYRSLGIHERTRITQRILDEIRGRMMEDIILLETSIANPQKHVFVLQFAVGEIDMVVFDPKIICCELYEIKHSDEAVAHQYQHLVDPEKTQEIEKQYGTIQGRYVLYRGEETWREEVHYLNVEEYLLHLGNPSISAP